MMRLKSKVLFFAAAFALLAILSACEKGTIVAEAPNQTILQQISEEQKCTNITCGQNRYCKSGDCICTENFRNCNKECISPTQCCSDNDCTEGKFCDKNNTCKALPQTCDYNQDWDAKTESCTCAQGTKSCEQQKKCIPEKNCCTPLDCTFRRDICVPTNYVASICLKDSQTHCKGIIEGQQALFTLQNNTFFKIAVKNILQDSATNILINYKENKTLNTITPLQLNKQVQAIVEQVKDVGGVCKLSE